MLLSGFIFLRLSAAVAVLYTTWQTLYKTTEKDKEQEVWGRDWYDGPQWDILYSVHYVFIYIGDVFDPSLLSLL